MSTFPQMVLRDDERDGRSPEPFRLPSEVEITLKREDDVEKAYARFTVQDKAAIGTSIATTLKYI